MNEEILNEETIEDPKTRQNPFTVIAKTTYGDYAVRDIQSNSSWSKNPYGEDYAIVPDEMVQAIMATHGFVDIELNEDGTEVVSFTAREIPEIPEVEPEPTLQEKLDQTNANIDYLAMMTGIEL